ncbi:hypothetical protein HJC23_004498 [Cyclotella cryptica]|uniref:COX assembly mitochondrial protein n=1 Tax=Cyclotella cryptica TaxID=29204 RepID=A0ABD3PRW3_9STRA
MAIMSFLLSSSRALSRNITHQNMTNFSLRSFTTTTPLQKRIGGSHTERNPKIKITLEQLRMAARGSGRYAPICHEQQEKVMNALEAAKFEVCISYVGYHLCSCNGPIYKYILEYDKCREDYNRNHKGKDKTMMRELNKYLVRPRKKQK